MPTISARTPTVVVSRDEPVLDAVLAAAAAAGEQVDVLSDPAHLPAVWPTAGAVFIGADLAARVAQIDLPARDRVHLVGAVAEDMARWSMKLHAAIAVIPEAADQLGAAVLGVVDSDTTVLAVVGASGGVGTSTLAVGLAQLSRQSVLLIDADPDGGGLDLALGLEGEPGWRWPDLANARGHLGSLRGQLPRLDEVEVISISRSGAAEPPPEAVVAVLGSGRRSHEWVVVDAGRGRGPAATEALRAADAIVLVVSAEVRGVAAAAGRIGTLRAERLPVAGVVLRPAPGSGIGAGEVSQVLSTPVWGVLPDDRGILAAGRRGGPPDRAAGRRWRRACAEVLQRVRR